MQRIFALVVIWFFTVAAGAEPVGVWVTFGHRDREPREWKGNLVLVGGELLRLEGWHFEEGDTVEGATWQAKTTRRAGRRRPNQPPLPVQPKGLVAVLRGDPETQMQVTTSQGTFSLRLTDLRYGVPVTALEGQVRIERVPVAVTAPAQSYARALEDPHLLPGRHVVPPRIPDENVGNSQEDRPALAVLPEGTVWAAWTSYLNEATDVRVARFDGERWTEPEVIVPRGDIGYLTLAAVGEQLWCVWSAQVDGNWDLFARARGEAGWGPIARLTSDPGADLFPRLAADAAGRMFLVWQGVRWGRFRVLFRTGERGKWGPERCVDEGAGNEWLPKVAPDGRGGAWIVWDTYAQGNYDVRLRHFDGQSFGEVIAVAATPRFEANAGVAVGPQGEVAVAWEWSGPNWGKDFGRFGRKGTTGLYPSRNLEVAVYRGGRWLQPPGEVAEALPPGQRSHLGQPQPAFDAQGRLWLFFRRRRLKYFSPWNRGIWETYATVATSQGWQSAVYFPGSAGGCGAWTEVASDPQGRFWVAWSTDQRPWRRPIPLKCEVAAALFEPAAAPGKAPTWEPRREPEVPSPALIHPQEPADIARLRAQVWQVGHRAYRLFRGDIHRHTAISWDGPNDGSLIDLYRYALDAAGLDFIGATDHVGWGVADRGNPEYPWWRTEQSCDAFRRPGQFLPLYAYERSIPWPFGHRNVIHPRRGIRPVTTFLTPEGKIAPDDTRRFYAELRRTGSIAMAHTSATVMGTNWADNDPEVEPLVEIYQGCRLSYEQAGAPRAAKRGGEFEPGFVAEALEKGYRLGFQASSDHVSTHISYFCLYAEELSPPALLEAIRQRRAYGATDNLLVEFSARDESGEHPLGAAFRPRGPVRFHVRVVGTGPLKQVVVIRNNEVVYTRKGEGPEVTFEYRDEAPPAGPAFYYLRVEQTDGQLAWASPIWLETAQ